jgi:hypothetical protein
MTNHDQPGLRGRSRLVRCIALVVAASVVATARPAAAAPDFYGAYSLGAIYSGDAAQTVDEELDASAAIGRIYGGLRLNPEEDETRIELSTGYFGYLTRDDRWTNRIEVEQTLKLGESASLSMEVSGATNIITLERRGADQAGVAGSLRLDSGNHRMTFAAAGRRRWYDADNATSWASQVGAAYRYRIGSWHSAELRATIDRVDSNLDTLDYERLQLVAYYTRPLAKRTRARAGLAHRRWTWGNRLAPDGSERSERLWVPQIRLTHRLAGAAGVELDYRYVIRRSNDDRFDRDGHRLAITFRNAF